VGDNEFDVVSGRKLGVNSVLINRNGRGENPGADYVIHDLNGILPLLDLE
jgi:phosphoglycolate phosphatase-like HAD superfamily hydrolase